jgi:hypothetical protein
MASCRRVRLGKWRLLMIACLVLVIFLTESYSLALSKRLSIPLMSASGGHGVAFLPELGGSLPRAALRSFLNLLSRLGRDCQWMPGLLNAITSSRSRVDALPLPVCSGPPRTAHSVSGKILWIAPIAANGIGRTHLLITFRTRLCDIPLPIDSAEFPS